MAENKKSFLLYCDQIHLFEELSDEEAGRVIKHLFRYVNDQNPEPPDRITKIVFEPMKRQLKRDLEQWENTAAGKSTSGTIGNLKRWNPEIYKQYIDGELTLEEAVLKVANRKLSQPDQGAIKGIAKIAVNVNDTVKVNKIDERKLAFASTLKPFVEKYGRGMVNEFYKYWTEPNKSKSKFRQEMEKTWDLDRRLETWAKNDKSFNTSKNNGSETPSSLGRFAPREAK